MFGRRLNNSNNNFTQRIFSGMATALFNLRNDSDGGPRKPEHDIIIYNKETGQPVHVPALSDQGNDITLLTEDWASRLGYPDYKQTGQPLGVTGVGGDALKNFYLVKAKTQIGTLQPFTSMIAFGPTPKNLIGRETVLGKFYVLYGPENVAYIQTSSFDNALEHAQASIKNQSLYGYQSSMAASCCRNRM